jgi:hypothetical protein
MQPCCERSTPVARLPRRLETYDGRVKDLPSVVADLTFTPVRGGRAIVPPGCWEEDRKPIVGEHVLVADAGAGPFEATVTSIEADGSLMLSVHAFAHVHA